MRRYLATRLHEIISISKRCDARTEEGRSILRGRMVGETRFDMDVTTHTFQHSPLPVRAFAGLKGAPSRSGRPAVSPSRRYCVSDVVEIFKKTPCAADLKPAGRDVAKDMLELDSMSVQDTNGLKIAGERQVARQTERQRCATSHTSKVIWEFACQDEAASFGAVVRSGRAHEKQCYADF